MTVFSRSLSGRLLRPASGFLVMSSGILSLISFPNTVWPEATAFSAGTMHLLGDSASLSGQAMAQVRSAFLIQAAFVAALVMVTAVLARKRGMAV